MQHKLKYGVNFLRDLKLIEPKAKLEPKPKPKPEVPTLEEQLEAFKKFHKIPENATLQAELTLVDDKLSVKWRGKWVPLYSNKKPLANSTLQTKYGAKFLKDLSIPTVKQKPAELVQLPFNQFKYDKDFKSSLDDFFLNESSVEQPKTLELEQLKSPEKVYFRSQILEHTSIDKYWNISGVPVLPENVIFTFFRMCWWHPEANNTGTPKWFSIAQYSCTSIWDLKYTFPKSPIGNYLRSYQMIIPSRIKDPILLFKEVKSTFEKTLESNLDSLGSLKYSIGLELVFKKEPDSFTDPPVRFYTKNEAVFNQDEINLDKQFLELGERIENFIQDGSGWQLSSLKTLWLDIAQYKPLKGSSYIPLPDVLKHKKAIINIKNDDEHCLRYTLRAALFPTSDNPQRISSYPTDDGLNFDGVKSPILVSQICKVEKLNNLAINVYGWENNKVIIYRISNQPYDVKRINTLLLEQDEKSHYVLIKNLNRLLKGALSASSPNFFFKKFEFLYH